MKHNDMVDCLENRIKSMDNKLSVSPRTILKEYDYRTYGKAGEVDLAVIHPRRIYLFEVKTTDTPKARSKAKKQLEKDVEYITQWYDTDYIHKFYVHSVGKNLYTIKQIP